jgi:flagellar biosynthetic protein FliQ
LTQEFAIQIIRDALSTAVLIAAPLLIVGFIVGIVMSLLQVLTSIQDSAFSAVPRLAAFLVAFVISMPWMLQRMMVYTTHLLGDLGRYGR